MVADKTTRSSIAFGGHDQYEIHAPKAVCHQRRLLAESAQLRTHPIAVKDLTGGSRRVTAARLAGEFTLPANSRNSPIIPASHPITCSTSSLLTWVKLWRQGAYTSVEISPLMTLPIKPSATPLIYRMVTRVAPLPKRGIEEVHRSILNRLRKYSVTSIADLALQMLWNPPGGDAEELRSTPWLTLLLVKWAIQDNHVNMRVGAPIPSAMFDRLRQELWELQGAIHGDKTNVWVMLRYLVHVQVEFQRRESWGFLRWPALYARLNPGSTNRRQFREVMGLEPEAFLDLAYGFYAAVLNRQMPLGQDYLSPFRPTYGASVDQMYELFVRDLSGLRQALQSEEAQRIRGKQELFEFPYIRRFPFLRLRDGRLHCWHPLVFARGLEDAVHLRLSSLGADYVNEFSRVYETYVTELATGSGLPSLDESAYKAQIGGHAPAVEAIIEGDGCNIFVEAKMSLFADDVLLHDNETVIFQKTKRVREAITQGWRVGELIRDPASGFGTRFQKDQDFLFVVTSRELNLGTGERMRRLYPPNQFDYPDAGAELRLPLSNVFILSIEDFERTMGCVAAGELNLSAVLKDAVVANQRAETARLFFSDFIGKYTNRWAMPAVMQDAKRSAERRIAAAFGVPPDALDDKIAE